MSQAEPKQFSRRFVSDVWQFVRPYRKDLGRAVIWTVTMQVLALVEPYLLMFIIDDIVEHGRAAESRILPLALGAFVLLVFTTGTKILKDRRIRNVFATVRGELPGRVLAKLLRLPLSYHEATNTGETVSKMQEGVTYVSEVVWMFLFEFFPLLVQTLVVICVLATLHWSLSLAVFVTIAVSWIYIIVQRKRWRWSREKRTGLWHKSNNLFGESIANVKTVQAFNREAHATARVDGMRASWKDLLLTEMSAFDRAHFIRNIGINFMRVGLVVLSAGLAFRGEITLGEVVFASMLVERLFNANFVLGSMYDRFIDYTESIRLLADVMQEPEPQQDPDRPMPIPDGPITLVLDGITYAYPSRPDAAVLKDVDLAVKPGMMVGIVGESGHGKSTLAKLLLRYDDPIVGTITLNSVDLRKARKADIRSRIGYVPQEVELFNATIAENIRYGKPNATDEEIVRAAKLARADLFIERTEHGYETLIGDRGLRLSGGERQRVGIARAVLTEAPMLVFDEATSSVDAETIYEIKRAMNALRGGGRTLVVITHQLSTVQDADLIVVLKDGRVSGMGTHVELVRSNETYKGFVQLQQNADSALLVASDPRNVS